MLALSILVGCLAIFLYFRHSPSSWTGVKRVLRELCDILKLSRDKVKTYDTGTSRQVAESGPFGTWEADRTFRYPPIEGLTAVDLKKIEPIPYRPFRWGPTYPITLGIAPMPWSNWLELDSHYKRTVAIRQERTAMRGKRVERCQPGFLAHAEECLAEMCAFLAQRYPEFFTIRRGPYGAEDPSSHGESIGGKEAGAIVEVCNKITGDIFNLQQLRKTEGDAWNPMKYAGLLQQDDLAVMVEDENGESRFRAGSICTAGGWRLEDKIDTGLSEIHTSGGVPQYRQKLKFSMERFFQKQKVHAPVQRNNYFFQIDDHLAWSDLPNGPEDGFDQATKGPRTEVKKEIDFTKPMAADDFDKIWFRSERQTLRRMPKTGCILFTIRTYLSPVHQLVKEPGVPGRMASAIKSWPEDVSNYKGASLYKNLLIPRLEALHREQVTAGQVAVDENGEVIGRDIRTYPF